MLFFFIFVFVLFSFFIIYYVLCVRFDYINKSTVASGNKHTDKQTDAAENTHLALLRYAGGYVKLSCFVATGATGAKGWQGATGAAGRVNAAPYSPTATTTTRPLVPCSGPVGEVSLVHAWTDDEEFVEQLGKLTVID